MHNAMPVTCQLLSQGRSEDEQHSIPHRGAQPRRPALSAVNSECGEDRRGAAGSKGNRKDTCECLPNIFMGAETVNLYA